MKKILILIVAAVAVISCGVATNLIDTITGGYRVSLPGTWTYRGTAVSLEGENALSTVSGAATAAKVEKQIDGYLSKIGIKPGAAQFTFNQDGTFTTTVSKLPLNGTWVMSEDGREVTLAFGGLITLATLKGSVAGSASGGCVFLFEGNKFLSFLKTLVTLSGNRQSYTQSINELMTEYSDMQVGFRLARVI